MSVSRFAVIPFVSLLVGAFAVATPAFAQETHIAVPPEKVQWSPAPPFLPAGAQIAVLEGNPAERGPVTLRLKFPANYVIPPHWHSMAERITVISGTFNVGMADNVDRNASLALGPAGFATMPSKMHHYAWVKQPTVVQVSLDGPFDIFYVHPTDDPQKAPATASAKP